MATFSTHLPEKSFFYPMVITFPVNAFQNDWFSWNNSMSPESENTSSVHAFLFFCFLFFYKILESWEAAREELRSDFLQSVLLSSHNWMESPHKWYRQVCWGLISAKSPFKEGVETERYPKFILLEFLNHSDIKRWNVLERNPSNRIKPPSLPQHNLSLLYYKIL